MCGGERRRVEIDILCAVGKSNGEAQESIIDNQPDKRLKAHEESECTPQLSEKCANEDREEGGEGKRVAVACLQQEG